MDTLSANKKLSVISGLVEGSSIRGISRIADVDQMRRFTRLTKCVQQETYEPESGLRFALRAL
jgi:hypothetical protein